MIFSEFFLSFKKNKSRFILIYTLFLLFFLTVSLYFYRLSLSKIAEIVISDIKNAVINDDYTFVRNSALKLVPNIFDEILISNDNFLLFSYKKEQPKFYMEIEKDISPSSEIMSGPSLKRVIFRTSLIPQVLISSLASLIALLLTIPFLLLEIRKNELIHQKQYFSSSRKLAHDIRSPLSTLNIISTKIENRDARALQIAVIAQINNIANELLSKTKSTSIIFIAQVIEQLEHEYNLKTKEIQRVITFKVDRELATTTFLAPKYLYSMLNNLIQNSIEATLEGAGVIEIFAKLDGNYISITIKDNGCGIREEILKKLGIRQITWGKGGKGNGLGVLSAMQQVKSSKGLFNINSKINFGTTISILLPLKF